MTTVEFVPQKHLCTSCGACEGICPKNAIKMVINQFGIYQPEINPLRCDNCGICVKVCPGHEFNYYDNCLFIHSALPELAGLGNYKALFAGHTTDLEILDIGQSGGFVSSLLCFCLDQKIIDGAVVTRWNPDSPLEPETIIARSREEVIAAAGSKYIPVPAASSIRTILQNPGLYAFVGTSCQIQAIHKAENIYKQLRENIILLIGLHCSGFFTYHFQDQLLQKVGLTSNDVAHIRHRDKTLHGWIGDMRIIDKTGRIYDLNRKESRIWPRPYFTNWRCRICFDKANEFSDISCGDCRIPEALNFFESSEYDLKKGVSEIVVRTEKGMSVFNRFKESGEFVLHAVQPDQIAKSIGAGRKKIEINTYIKVAKLCGLGIPFYGAEFRNPSETSDTFCLKTHFRNIWQKVILPFTSLLIGYLNCLSYLFMRNWLYRRIMMSIPHRWLGLLNKIAIYFKNKNNPVNPEIIMLPRNPPAL